MTGGDDGTASVVTPPCYVAPVAGGERRILVVSSSGGVLLDLMAMRPWWTRHDVSWVAVDAPDTRELLDGARVTWASELTPSRPVDVVGPGSQCQTARFVASR